MSDISNDTDWRIEPFGSVDSDLPPEHHHAQDEDPPDLEPLEETNG